MPIDLIIQLISGAVGGNLAGSVLKNVNLGVLWNSIAGVVGGGLAGQVLGPMLGIGAKSMASGMDPMSIIMSILNGGVGGGVLMAIVGMIKQMTSKA